MLGTLFTAVVVLGAVVALGGWHWRDLFEDCEEADGVGRYRDWTVKGLGTPLVLWALFNAGIVPGVPSLSTEIELARAAGANPVGPVLLSLAQAALAVAGYWAAATYGWMLGWLAPRLADRTDLAVTGVLVAVLAVPLGWGCLRVGGWMAGGWAAALWLVPTLHMALSLDQRREVPPCYSRALAKLQFRKFAAAEHEVLQELERCQDDFEGWMMLAELYAHHFGEVLEADLTVREVCEQPNVSGAQIALAFHRLADWHLKLADDPIRAREALQTILHKLPRTHFARMAQQRIDQLPRSREEWRAQREAKPLRLPALKDPLEGSARPSAMPGDRAAAAQRATQLVDQLRQDPDNAAAREAFALILADELGDVEQGMAQLELLLGMPGQPEGSQARWLSLIAAWQVRHRQDWAAAVPLFERLVREFPQTPQAFMAQRHLKLHEVEERLRSAGRASQPSSG